MNKLDRLARKYARGGRVSTPHALAAVKRAIAHVERGDHAAARKELMRSPDAMHHPHVQMAMGLLGHPGGRRISHFNDGGRVTGSSSPGSPGVSGAIRDAVNAARDYLIDRPRREIQAAREQNENEVVDDTYSGPVQRSTQADDGYAEGGKVSNLASMAKFMIDKMGIDEQTANRLAKEYHAAAVDPVSAAAKQLAADLAGRSSMGPIKKSPTQLAQQLAAGHVDPAELSHLMYTDPTLTPLINRYQSGVDNQNLTPVQKQKLIQKLASMGQQAPPPVPAASARPPMPPQGMQAPPPQGGMRPPGPQMPPAAPQAPPQMQGPPPGQMQLPPVGAGG